MLVFTQTTPWMLKALNTCIVLTTEMHAIHVNGSDKHAHILLFLNILTPAMLIPSVVSPMADRRLTTSYIVQSVLFLVGMQYAIALLPTVQMEQYTVPLMCACVCHMLWSQGRALSLHKKVLIYQRAVQYVVWSSAVLLWIACTLMMPRLKVEIIPLIALLWTGEFIGLTVALLAMVLESAGAVWESLFE